MLQLLVAGERGGEAEDGEAGQRGAEGGDQEPWPPVQYSTVQYSTHYTVPGHQAPTQPGDSGPRPDTEAGTRSVCSTSSRPPGQRVFVTRYLY